MKETRKQREEQVEERQDQGGIDKAGERHETQKEEMLRLKTKKKTTATENRCGAGVIIVPERRTPADTSKERLQATNEGLASGEEMLPKRRGYLKLSPRKSGGLGVDTGTSNHCSALSLN